MAHWRRQVLETMTERILQMGLEECPICHSGQMGVARRPVVLSSGAVYQEPEVRRDHDSNVLFMVLITCNMCGYAMLFDSERHTTGDEESLFIGTDDEEAVWEATQSAAENG